jgi:hypothetical protein
MVFLWAAASGTFIGQDITLPGEKDCEKKVVELVSLWRLMAFHYFSMISIPTTRIS